MSNQQQIEYAQRVGAAVREFNEIIRRVTSDEGVAATSAGDGSAVVDGAAFARAWEGAGPLRDQMILCLARDLRNEWRRDVAQIIEVEDPATQAYAIANALDLRLRSVFDFGFAYLTPRYMCLLCDSLVICLEADMPTSEILKEISESASRCTRKSAAMLEALILGGSGMFRYEAQKLFLLR